MSASRRMSQRVAAAVMLGLLFTGCSTRALRFGDESTARVEDLRLTFEPGERGEVQLDLVATNRALPAAAYTEISWELWLGNRWFAAGTQAMTEPAPKDAAHPFTVRAPLVFRRLQPARDEPVSVDVGVRGAVTLRAPGGSVRLPFELSRRMSVENLPQFGSGADGEE